MAKGRKSLEDTLTSAAVQQVKSRGYRTREEMIGSIARSGKGFLASKTWQTEVPAILAGLKFGILLRGPFVSFANTIFAQLTKATGHEDSWQSGVNGKVPMYVANLAPVPSSQATNALKAIVAMVSTKGRQINAMDLSSQAAHALDAVQTSGRAV